MVAQNAGVMDQHSFLCDDHLDFTIQLSLELCFNLKHSSLVEYGITEELQALFSEQYRTTEI